MREMKTRVPIRRKLVEIHKFRDYYLLLVVPFAFLILFKYVPMYGTILAFKDFKMRLGILESPWADPIYKHFQDFFKNRAFGTIMRNTIVISCLKIFVAFPAPILFALLLNEIQNLRFRKLTQTVSYLPHFISWVVMATVFIDFFSLDGIVNSINRMLGRPTVIYMAKSEYFWPIITLTHIWKTFGWSSIIYFAALAGVDPNLYEAAEIDGAGRFRRAISITIPSIMPTIVILMILNMGGILNAGFDQIFNMRNEAVNDVSNILDTYVYEQGLLQRNYSFSTAVDLMKSVVGLVMVLTVNKIASFLDKDNALW